MKNNKLIISSEFFIEGDNYEQIKIQFSHNIIEMANLVAKKYNITNPDFLDDICINIQDMDSEYNESSEGLNNTLSNNDKMLNTSFEKVEEILLKIQNEKELTNHEKDIIRYNITNVLYDEVGFILDNTKEEDKNYSKTILDKPYTIIYNESDKKLNVIKRILEIYYNNKLIGAIKFNEMYISYDNDSNDSNDIFYPINEEEVLSNTWNYDNPLEKAKEIFNESIGNVEKTEEVEETVKRILLDLKESKELNILYNFIQITCNDILGYMCDTGFDTIPEGAINYFENKEYSHPGLNKVCNKNIHDIIDLYHNKNVLHEMINLKDPQNFKETFDKFNRHSVKFGESTFRLNEKQDEIYKYIIDIMSTDKKVIAINGPAGTGKSTLVGAIIKTLEEQGLTMAVTAPTHKAVEVLSTKIEEILGDKAVDNDDIILSTIHSFLKLKMKIIYDGDNEGQVEFIPDTNPNNPARYVDILFVDEDSMLSEEMRKKISYLFKLRRIKKLIYVGDKYQLDSVDDPHSDNKIYNSKYALQLDLTEVMRQENPEDNEILDKSVIIRTEIDKLINARKGKQYNQYYDLQTGYNIFNNLLNPYEDLKHIKVYSEFTNNVDLFLKNYFKDDNNKSIIGYTNRLVDDYNTFLRNENNNNWQGESEKLLENINNLLYIPTIVVGDELVFQQPHVVDGCPYHQNGEVVTVEECKDEYISIFEFSNCYVRRLNGIDELRYYTIVDNKEKWIKILHPSSKTAFDSLLDMLKGDAMRAKGKDKAKAWKEFYRVSNYFQKTKYAYSSTIHKSQGSTYNNVYIDMREMFNIASKNIYNLETCFRLIYVAITRPKNNVYVLR